MNAEFIPGVEFYGGIHNQGLTYLHLTSKYDFVDKADPSKEYNYNLQGLDPKQLKIKRPTYEKRGVTGRIPDRSPRERYNTHVTDALNIHRSALQNVRKKE